MRIHAEMLKIESAAKNQSTTGKLRTNSFIILNYQMGLM